MNKYYIPHPDEFHTGFIYEKLTDEGWEERVVTLEDTGGENEYRVRILSPDDIMNKGFTLKGETPNRVYVFKKVIDSIANPRMIDLIMVYNGDFPFISIEIDEEVIVKSILIQNKGEFDFLLSRLCL